MIVRTWRQGSTLMASAVDAPLDAEALDLVSAQARKRWPALEDAPGMLLAGDVDEDARALMRERPELIGDIRQVDGLSSGWALAWIDPESLATGQ